MVMRSIYKPQKYAFEFILLLAYITIWLTATICMITLNLIKLQFYTSCFSLCCLQSSPVCQMNNSIITFTSNKRIISSILWGQPHLCLCPFHNILSSTDERYILELHFCRFMSILSHWNKCISIFYLFKCHNRLFVIKFSQNQR